MTMTRQHFQLIAEVIRTTGDDYQERVKYALNFANRLASTNPQFDRDRFIDVATGKRER